ncbi:putative oxidoreductase TM_0325 [Styela clava]|uniref:uncharacterized oxidoreductase TM_0325-like n=1 Tax=Styela clava TaxID=7725 RepID=UPI00193AD50A|nr:uncharacterized oxidoreductase TM_0325-like [Styela clava]
MDSLKDKVVVITGAAGGIGSEAAKLFSKSGSKLFLTDLDQGRLNSLIEECKKSGAKEVHGVRADSGVMSDLENISKKTIECYGKVDVLVNNVGFAKKVPYEEHTEADYNSTLDVNLKAAFFLTKWMIPELIKTRGTIVNLSSAAATNPEPRFMAYSVAKAGIDHFTRSLAREYAPQGIRVNAIGPGPVRTAFHPDHAALEKISAEQPLCGILEPAMIARWILFLSSQEAGPITGQVIVVDGGRTVTRIPVGYGPVK